MDISTDSPVILKIKSVYPNLKEAEKRAADYILEHTEEFIFENLAASARNAGVSEATFVRFSKVLGYRGYRELHIAIAAMKTTVPDSNISNLEINDSTAFSDIPEIVIGRTIRSLSNMRQTLDLTQFEKAVEALESARRICIFGVGNSAFVGADLAEKLLRLRKSVEASNDPHTQAMHAVTMGQKDVAIAITHSGKTRQTVEMLLLAKKQGAKIICITNFESSPAARFSDVCLLTASHENLFNSENLMSRLSQLTIIDMLYLGIINKNYKRYAPMIEKQIQTVVPLFFQSKDYKDE